jgi:S-adenosylmethionine synthetase
MRRIVELPFPGQSDRICDIIVENIVEEYLKRDARSRLNIQALGSPGMFMLCGMVSSQADFDVSEVIRQIYDQIGYKDPIEPFIHLEPFTTEQEKLVQKNHYQDTVIVHGFASSETREKLPKPLVLAHNYWQKINSLRLNDSRFNWLMPDGKIILAMNGNEIEQLILDIQHARSIQPLDLKNALLEELFSNLVNSDSASLLINSAGTFIEGGLQANSGLSQVNQDAINYGGLFPKNSISYIGKDPWHPAKSGHFFARFLAKDLMEKFEVDFVFARLIYSPGATEPIAIEARLSDGRLLEKRDLANYDPRISAIMERWQLQNLPFGKLAESNLFMNRANPFE